MINFLKRHKAVLILVLAELVLFATNYKANTYLVGWDNVFPELNFSANLQRGIFSLWQEYRGLGVLDGMAHAALLPHTLTVWFLSLILPTSLLRYVVTFSLHLLGGIGTYWLLKRLRKPRQDDIIPLFGALFYQLNLITVQMFYTPLEVFSYHFAALPFLLYCVLEYLENGHKKTLLWFMLLSFLSLPQAHVPSVFLVYFLAVLTLILFRASPKRGATIILVIIVINSFWGLPYVYTTLNASKTIVNSKINQMSTENVILRNKAFGDFKNVALLRGFTLDYVDYQPNGTNDYMMSQWRQYINKPPVFVLSMLFFLIAVYGLFKTVIKKQRRYYPFLVLFVFTFLMLGNNIPILSLFSTLFSKYLPLFSSVFRFAFTKFSLLYVLCYTLFLCLGLDSLISSVVNNRRNQIIIVCLTGSLFVYTTLPSFQGNFIYNNLRLEIPQSYGKLINYFKAQNKNSRIVILPQPSYWGWVYYQWGLHGSGFIWYGLPQATLDGAFYPWSESNENFYWEITQAVYSNDQRFFEKVLDKYQIDWVIIDRNIISPFSTKAVYTEKLQEMLIESSKTQTINNINNLYLYKTNLSQNIKNYVFIDQDLPVVEPAYHWNNMDQAYLENGDYVSVNDYSPLITNNLIYYPFRSLFTGRNQDELEFEISEDNSNFIFKTHIPKDLLNASFVVPALLPEDLGQPEFIPEEYQPRLYLDDELIGFSADGNEIPLTYIRQGELKVVVPKIPGLYSYNNLDSADLFNKEVENCEQFNQGVFTHEQINLNGDSFLRLLSIGSNNCLDFSLPDLIQRLGYLITVKSNNVQGRSLLFNLSNNNSQRSDLEVYLPQQNEKTTTLSPVTSFFVIPPLESNAYGYNLHFDNSSIGKEKTVNDLGRITVNPIPYRFLTSLKIQGRSSSLLPGQSNIYPEINVLHPNPSYYQITINGQVSEKNTLILSQSFDKGWKAYQVQNWLGKTFPFLFGKELKDHVLVNNWQNGWKLSGLTDNKQSTSIVLFYLPQLLEYLGFIILLAGSTWLVYRRDEF